MKKLIVLGVFLSFSSFLSAQSAFQPGDIFAGAGPEINAHTRDGIAFGGILMAGIELGTKMAAGVRAGYYYDFKTVSSFEAQGFFRYYLPWLEGLYAQAEIGVILYTEYDELFPAVSGGLSAGWRFTLADVFFIEPSVRGGYPYIWGVTITAGYIFKINWGQGRNSNWQQGGE